MKKTDIKKIHRLFPEKIDIVKGNFSYVKYIEDVAAFRKGIYQGYFEDYIDVDLQCLYSDEPLLESEEVYPEELASKIGNLQNLIYDKEIETLHKEFVKRIEEGEDISTVDIDISAKMEELATRNIDGTHTLTTEEKTR